jgi:hypothetical protein
MVITGGLVGPKPIPNGGGDGQQVNIPAHGRVAMERRSVVPSAAYWIAVEGMRRYGRQIRHTLLQVQSNKRSFGLADAREHTSEKIF